MSTESIKILIEADNKASGALVDAEKAIDASVKGIKETGERSKKSAEFVSVLAKSLGGSELGAFAMQVGDITGKVSQFSEVQKLGGAGALAFKAGLVGAAAVIGFQVGSAIGNAIFQTERWKKAMADAKEEAARLEQQLIALKAQTFSDVKADIELIRDPEAKKTAYAQLFAATKKEIEGVEKRVHEAKAAVDAYDASWTPSWIQGNNAAMEERLKKDREALKALQDSREAIRAEALERKAANEELAKTNALRDRSDAYIEGLQKELQLLNARDKILAKSEQNTFGDAAAFQAADLTNQIEALKKKEEAEKEAAKAIEDKQKQSDSYLEGLRKEVALLRVKKDEVAGLTAAQNTVGGAAQQEAEMLLKQRDALKLQQEEQQKAADKKKEDAQKIADLKQSELNKLEEERILLFQGKEAAHAFALEKQGLDKATAKDIAKQTALNEKLKSKPTSSTDTALQAIETRLATRGTTDTSKEILQATLEMVAQLSAVSTSLVSIDKNTNVSEENP